MRKVILFIASSLDNFIAREDGGIDWLFSEGDYDYKEFYDSVDTIFMGRKTYETALKLGEGFQGKECYVFTRSRTKEYSSQRNVHFESDPVGLTKRLVTKHGKGIFLEGGGEIVSAFLNNHLINEIVLSIHPVVLGKGIALFWNVNVQVNLKLLKSKTYKNGLVQLNYKVIRN